MLHPGDRCRSADEPGEDGRWGAGWSLPGERPPEHLGHHGRAGQPAVSDRPTERHHDVRGAGQRARRRRDDEVAGCGDGRDRDAGRERSGGQVVEEGGTLDELRDGRRRGVDRSPGDRAEAVVEHAVAVGDAEARGEGGERRTVVWRAEGDELLDAVGVGAADQRRSRDQAALGVGDDVDRDAGVRGLDVDEERAQPATSLPQVTHRHRPVVRPDGHAVEGADPGDAATGVGELHPVGVVVAEGLGVHVEHVGTPTGRPVAADQHRDPALVRWCRGGGARRRAPALPCEQQPPCPGAVSQRAPQQRRPRQPPGRGRDHRRLVGQPAHHRLADVPDRPHPGHRRSKPAPLDLDRAWRPVLDGDQVHLDGSACEEQRRVDVAPTGTDPEVEGASAPAHDLPALDPVAPADEDLAEEGVAGAQAVGVEHHHVELAPHRAGEGDLARAGGSHVAAVGDVVVEAPVAGGVRVVR